MDMSVVDLRRAMTIIINDLEEAIKTVLQELGVPTGATTLYDFVEAIYPLIVRARREIYAEQVIQMGIEIAEHGLQVKPAALRDYRPSATYKTLASALNVGVDKRVHIPITFLDDATRAGKGEEIIVTDELRYDPEVVEIATKRIVAAAERHARDAGRQAIIDTAAGGEVRPEPRNDAATDQYRGDPRGGTELGWARVLTGSENCVMCAMLASRGPVYTRETVLTATGGPREGMIYHTNCDCDAVLVIKGRKWEGEAEYKKLKEMWDSASSDPTEDEVAERLERPIDRFSKRWRDTEDKTVYAPGTNG